MCQLDLYYLYHSSKSTTCHLEFYFNFNKSILRKLALSANGSCPLPHQTFIATPLLPCVPSDPPICKYTGNGSVGPANDDLTKAIHAFVHFSLVVSKESLLFCDLQGLDICNSLCHASSPLPIQRDTQFKGCSLPY